MKIWHKYLHNLLEIKHTLEKDAMYLVICCQGVEKTDFFMFSNYSAECIAIYWPSFKITDSLGLWIKYLIAEQKDIFFEKMN